MMADYLQLIDQHILRAHIAGVAATDGGFIDVDIQIRSNVSHIFSIGDIVGPMQAHKAVYEAHVAIEVIAGELQGNNEFAAATFSRRLIPSVTYIEPEVVLVEQAKEVQGIKVKKCLFPWAALPSDVQLPMAATKALPSGCLTIHQKPTVMAVFLARSW